MVAWAAATRNPEADVEQDAAMVDLVVVRAVVIIAGDADMDEVLAAREKQESRWRPHPRARPLNTVVMKSGRLPLFLLLLVALAVIHLCIEFKSESMNTRVNLYIQLMAMLA